MIYYLHIHKVAGSTFVKMAENNGEILYQPNKNANPYVDEDNIIPIWNFSHNELKDFTHNKPYTFIANETCLNYFHQIEDLKYISIIRHPIDIIMSNYHHTLIDRYISFDDYLNTDSNYIKNPLIYYFSGSNNYQLALDRALRFDHILRLDRISEDIHCMKEFGWKELDTNRYRDGTRRNTNSKNELDKDIYSKLESKMQPDIDLYHEIYNRINSGKIIK